MELERSDSHPETGPSSSSSPSPSPSPDHHVDDGTTELFIQKTLLDNILAIRDLCYGNSVKAELIQRYYRKILEILELFTPAIEVVPDVALDDPLTKALEELNALVTEVRTLMESWHHMMSKIYFVLQIEPLIMRISVSVLEICGLLHDVSPSQTKNSLSACIQKIEQIQYDKTLSIINDAIKDQAEREVPGPEHLEKLQYSLGLGTNQELLMEAVALEKLKAKVGSGEDYVETQQIDDVIALVTHMHDCLVRIKQVHNINGVPVPADFCCPLSLNLMSDPVIVSSGQTYERAFIKKWLDQGINVCPKTRQTLTHTNLIPNYTVKALIANWCELNDVKLPDPLKSMDLNLPPAFLSHSNLIGNHSHQSANYPRGTNLWPSESNRSKMSSGQKNTISSNGSHHDSYVLEKHTSPLHSLSTGSPLLNVNGGEPSLTRLSLANSDGKYDCVPEEKNNDSGAIAVDISSQNPPQMLQNEHIQGHSRSMSASSTGSGTSHLKEAGEVNMIQRNSGDMTPGNASGEVIHEVPAPLQRESEFPQRLSENRSRSQNIWRRPSDRPRILTSSSMDSRPDLAGIETKVRKLIEDLQSESIESQRDAAAELRLLAKHNMENRIVIADCGAIILLVGLLHSPDAKTQEHAVTALLNLSINDNNKTAIANADAIDPLIHVLETGNPEARENSAATLFSLSVIEENKVRIGCSGAIKPLVELLGNGTPRGKKDAATALFNLSILHLNKTRIVQAGAVKHLVELMDPAAGMVDKAVAVLSNLATIKEGQSAIGHAHGIPALVEVVELGSARAKENAAAALLQLCTNSSRFITQVLQEGAVPPLVALSQSGTARAKEKAQSLLTIFRNHRHGNGGRP